MVAGDFDHDEGAEHNEVRREWEELQEGEVQENFLDEAARAEFSEEEEEGWEESEEAGGEDPPDDPEELPPVFAQEKPSRPQWRGDSAVELPRRPMGWNGKPKQRGLVKPDEVRQAFSPHERLLILDTWQRSGLAAGDFAPLVGISKHTLYLWKKRFSQHGPAGLAEHPRGASTGSKLPEVTKRTIVMLKELHSEWGVQRISDELLRGPALSASATAVARVLHEAGYQMEERRTRPHPEKQPHRFERAKPNQMWQTDLFTFVLKRQNRRLYLVGFLDDHSRFMVGYGLHASASSALVLEVLRAGIASYGPPVENRTRTFPRFDIRH